MGQIIEMRRRYGAGAGVLPYDARVEWLESTGKQFIVLPFSNVYSIHIEFLFTSVTAQDRIYGGRNNAQSLYANRSLGLAFARNSDWRQLSPNSVAEARTGVRYTADYNATTRTMSVVANYGTCSGKSNVDGDDPPSIAIFGTWSNGFVNGMKGRIYRFRYQNMDRTKIIMDLVPVRVGNVGYMYDRVSRQLFGNAGTGEFIVGPDIV